MLEFNFLYFGKYNLEYKILEHKIKNTKIFKHRIQNIPNSKFWNTNVFNILNFFF